MRTETVNTPTSKSTRVASGARHVHSSSDVAQKLTVDPPMSLSADEVARRLSTYGMNAFQEYRDERAVAALKLLAAQSVKVLRDGQQTTIPASNSSRAMSWSWRSATASRRTYGCPKPSS